MITKEQFSNLALWFICTVGFSQNTISLEQASAQLLTNGKYSNNVSAVLDLNHTYDRFIGTWQVVYEGRMITFYVEKEIVTEDEFTSEELTIRHSIIDANGNIIFDDTSDADPAIFSEYVSAGSVIGYFVDNNPCTHEMLVYITPMISLGSTTLTLGFEFFTQGGTLNSVSCPSGLDATIYPDQTRFIATKL